MGTERQLTIAARKEQPYADAKCRKGLVAPPETVEQNSVYSRKSADAGHDDTIGLRPE
jgi:hypothetical protein